MQALAIDSELVCHPEKQAAESKADDLLRMLCNCDDHTQYLVNAVAKAVISASAKN